MTVQDTLQERGQRYGSFSSHARITQTIKAVMEVSPNWSEGKLSADMKEALDMIAHKIGRILNGDPNYADSWHDIAGYATLVDQRLAKLVPPPPGLDKSVEPPQGPKAIHVHHLYPPPVSGSPLMDKLAGRREDGF